jgi:HTH-type transcriptional regulator / antitoxin HigA
MKNENQESVLNGTSVYDLLTDDNIKTISRIIEEKCEEWDISQRQLSTAINISRGSLQRIMNEEADSIDVLDLLKVSNFFNIDLSDLIKIHVANAETDEIKKLESARRNGYIINNFDLKTLKSIGFINSQTDFDEIEKRIKKFFGYNSVFEYSAEPVNFVFSRTNRNYSDKMLKFWLSIVMHQISKLKNPNPYDREKLLKILPKIRIATLDEEYGFTNFCKALYECGVTVIVESYLSKTQIRGATFIIEEKPYIVLTNLNKRLDTLWFTLAHELCHTIEDFDFISKQVYHLSGDKLLFEDELLETRANEFAKRMLLSESNLKYIERFISVEGVVKEFAKQINIHYSIIYGFYLDKNPDDYPRFRPFIVSSEIATKNLEIIPWQKTTLEETIPELRSKHSYQMN